MDDIKYIIRNTYGICHKLYKIFEIFRIWDGLKPFLGILYGFGILGTKGWGTDFESLGCHADFDLFDMII